MICYAGEGEPEEVRKDPGAWYQDEDVLDTWFSSALWPFSVLGWPNETGDLKKFYPNSVMITGHDILFFWVARMVLMGEYALNEAPFPTAYLHGLIYGKSYWRNLNGGGIQYVNDEERIEYDLGKPTPKDVYSKWEKMSKSKGNIIDPMEIIDEYGTDAMRMALCASATQAREIDLDRRRFEEFKNFANKIWNGARFVFMNLEGDSPLTTEELQCGVDEELLALEDRWILSVLNKTVKEVIDKLNNFLFDQAALQAYDFFWKEFCSYYLEIAKPTLFGRAGKPGERKNKQKLLVIVLCQAIRLIHPMAPFITEELFQRLKTRFHGADGSHSPNPYTAECIKALQAKACMVAAYPHVVRMSDLNPIVNETFDLVGRIVYTVRNVRGEMKLPPGAATDIYIVGNSGNPNFITVKENLKILEALVHTKEVTITDIEPDLGFCSTGLVDGLKVIIPLPHALLEQEKARLAKEENRLSFAIEKLKAQLANESFTSRAPPELISQQYQKLDQAEAELREIVEKLAILSQR
jgi:valyl-tRNA synthetase